MQRKGTSKEEKEGRKRERERERGGRAGGDDFSQPVHQRWFGQCDVPCPLLPWCPQSSRCHSGLQNEARRSGKNHYKYHYILSHSPSFTTMDKIVFHACFCQRGSFLVLVSFTHTRIFSLFLPPIPHFFHSLFLSHPSLHFHSLVYCGHMVWIVRW